MPFELRSFSRFKNTEHVRVDGVETFGRWKRPPALEQLDINQVIKLQVTSDLEGRPDLIANEYYYSPYYDWIIIMYNNPENPVGWPKTGEIIDIPIRNAISELF